MMDLPPQTNEESLVRLISAHWIMMDAEIPEWMPHPMLRERKVNMAEGLSIPDWLHEVGQEELQDEWVPIMKSLNEKASVILRVNLLKTTLEKLKKNLSEEGIETETLPDYPHALKLVKRANVFRTNAFKEGHFEVQDAASQKVVEMLDVKPGEKVIDACAGAGGKSLHMASLMKNKGKIIALDLYERKLDELRQRASRNGVDIIEARLIESTKVIKRLEGSADAVLLDVPCTGTGALKRNPDTKWKLLPERLGVLKEIQQDILRDYSKMVAPKGRMVYATCSILPSENERQVQRFLAEVPGWKLIREHKELPHIQGYDGFYMALMMRSN